jgi:hypothetical protein
MADSSFLQKTFGIRIIRSRSDGYVNDWIQVFQDN